MRPPYISGATAVLAGGFLLAACAGCARPGAERFVPPPENARRALETALDAWKQGRPAGRVGAGPPAVCVVDTHRRPGQRLRKYAILGEVPGDMPRCFAVRLYLEDPREEVKVRYLLVGVDPLWVYRHEDYEMFIHWACGTEEPGKPKSTPSPPTPVPARPLSRPEEPHG